MVLFYIANTCFHLTWKHGRDRYSGTIAHHKIYLGWEQTANRAIIEATYLFSITIIQWMSRLVLSKIKEINVNYGSLYYVFNIVMLIIESSVKIYPILRRCLMLTNQVNNLPPSLLIWLLYITKNALVQRGKRF